MVATSRPGNIQDGDCPLPELHHCLLTSMFPELLFLLILHFGIFILEQTQKRTFS